MSERRQAVAERYLNSVYFHNFTFFGGYENSERKVLGLFYDEVDTTAFPVSALEFKYRKCDKLTHRDFLGALMGAGVSRETVGDISTQPGRCNFFITAEIAPYILQNFTSAGRTALHLSQVPLEQVTIAEPETKEIRDTVSSLRLDSIISSGFRIGRSLACDYIHAGRAAINGLPCEKPDKQIPEGAKISVRGLGKIRLRTINGETKKGRISVILDRYV
jgi:RNA-binding protein YlmH